MGHLAAAKRDCGLHLVSALKKSHNVISLDFKVVLASPRSELNFLKLNGSLVLSRVVLALTLLIQKFSVVDDPANRRDRPRRNFNQVEPPGACGFKGIPRRHDAKLFALLINHANFLGANPLVYSNKAISDRLLPPNQLAKGFALDIRSADLQVGTCRAKSPALQNANKLLVKRPIAG